MDKEKEKGGAEENGGELLAQSQPSGGRHVTLSNGRLRYEWLSFIPFSFKSSQYTRFFVVLDMTISFYVRLFLWVETPSTCVENLQARPAELR